MESNETTNYKNPDSRESGICCPSCQHTDVYRLGDGRYKCKQCKKKFSANRTRSRIPLDTLNALAKHFWNMDTAEKCASSLAINRKTAQSYYDRLRNHLAQENMRELLSLSGHEKNRPGLNDDRKLPVFWSLLQHNKIYIVFPETLSFSREKNDLPDVQGISEIYTNSPSARKNNTLDKFYRRTLWARKETDEKTLQQFWRQAKINLAKYRGGCKNNFPLFIVEMAFRFNYQEDEGAIHLLQKKIRESTPETYTEKIGR